MYKRNAQGWSKHFDFIIVDEISLQIAFILAVLFRHHIWAYSAASYRALGFFLILADAVILVLNNSMHNVISRSIYNEFIETTKHCFLVFSITTIFLFSLQVGNVYSRIITFVTFILYIFLSYSFRLLWKLLIKKLKLQKQKRIRMLVVATLDSAEGILDRLSSDELADYQITGVVLTEEHDKTQVGGYPVVSDIGDVADYIVREWIDSVYIDVPFADEKVLALLHDCTQMAIPTHYHFPNVSKDKVKRFAEKIGGTMVLTTSINYATPIQTFIKRCFDIIAGLFGSVIALIVMLIVGPIIKKESPGPILFTQERIGQNGKRFKMYKIRSMYMDAEERKKDLIEQNRVKDGMMFKLDFDPRIIGNKVLPDGSKITGIGDKIRRYSLDEWPQFFNVLRGEMSCIGTRPPTIDEWNKYEYHHRARLAIKPGITGMWQVNGRSEITDFEEVVRLDTEYIANWSIELDIKIILKTIKVLFTREGAM